MTPTWLLAVAVVLATGCDRQLNAEWCSTHRDDQDCINAGLVQVDAPPACPATPCTETGALVCDTGRGGVCVQCLPGGQSNPPNCHCGTDDSCHECLVNEDCGAGGLCLPDFTCVGGGSGGSGQPDNLLYADPNGTGDCTSQNKCNLKTAISMVTATKHVIELDAGEYKEGPITISQSMVLIGPNPGSGHVYQDPENITGRAVIEPSGGATGPVLTVTAGTVALFELSVAGSPDDAGVRCTGATLEVYHDVIRDNSHEGITASGCPLTIERSVFTKNGSTGTTYEGIYADNCSPIAIRNNFVFGNGNGQSTKGAVHFHGTTVGDFRFNSVGYNHAQKSGPGQGNQSSAVGGVYCESNLVVARDNIVTLNDNINFGIPQGGGCQQLNNYLNLDPKWTSQTDLHLKPDSPTPAIVNNSNSDCTYAKGYDIDFDARPLGNACDLGADEAR